MKSFGLYSLLVGTVLVLLLISVGVMGWNAWGIAASGTAAVSDTWKTGKLLILTPIGTNVIAMVVLGIIYVMG